MRVLMKVLVVLILVAGVAAFLAWRDYQETLDAPLALPAEGMVYQFKPGSSVARLAADLAEAGVLKRPLYLRLYARQTGLASQLKAGEYRIPADTTLRGLVAQMVEGKSIQYQLTIVEGWTFAQARAAIAADPVLVQTLADLSDEEVMHALGLEGLHPEGQFFPDTYHFPRGTTDREFLQRAHRRLQQVLDEAWAGRDQGLPLASPYEALILASIIEKETGSAGERTEIAGVFTRRLRKGMLLQTDPTVIYGLGAGFDGNLRRRDLRTDTPYNTYTRRGLPPTPICLPGRAAIEAATHPADGKALYFVSKGDGSHQFSDTLREHNAAVRRYQLKRR